MKVIVTRIACRITAIFHQAAARRSHICHAFDNTSSARTERPLRRRWSSSRRMMTAHAASPATPPQRVEPVTEYRRLPRPFLHAGQPQTISVFLHMRYRLQMVERGRRTRKAPVRQNKGRLCHPTTFNRDIIDRPQYRFSWTTRPPPPAVDRIDGTSAAAGHFARPRRSRYAHVNAPV